MRITNWNKRQPDLETLQNLANFFDVTTDYLIKGEENQQITQDHIKETLDRNQITMFVPGFDWESFDKLSPEEQQILLRNFNDQIKVVLQIKEQGNKT